VVPGLRTVLRAVDPELPMAPVMTMSERLGTSVGTERFRTAMIVSSAALALLLSCLGIYAIRSQAVAARTREMGVRLAVGATPAQLLAMTLTQGMVQVAAGIVAGLVIAGALAGVLEPWLFATRATEPRVLLAASALFTVAALAASWGPARRAASVDPLVLLRHD
jgi:putative ABC transport system permease protein